MGSKGKRKKGGAKKFFKKWGKKGWDATKKKSKQIAKSFKHESDFDRVKKVYTQVRKKKSKK